MDPKDLLLPKKEIITKLPKEEISPQYKEVLQSKIREENVLQRYGEDGVLNTYMDSVYAMDYKERPVTMKELLCDPEFFGSLTDNGKSVYPGWFRILEDIRTESIRYNVVLTGAIGFGKSRAAVWGIAALLQRLLCLKDPWKFLGIARGGKLNIVFFNLVKSMSRSLGYSLLHQHLLASPWFRARGIPHDKDKVPYLELPFIDFLLGSPKTTGFGSLGSDVIGAVMDEVDSPNESIGTRERIINAYDLTVRRFENRFVSRYGETIGKFFLVASKQDKLSFLNTFVESRKESPFMYLVDKPIWEIKPDKSSSGRTFKVAIGNKFIASRIDISDKQVEECLRKGLEVIDVPIEYLDKFQLDPDGAIKDLAGKSIETASSSKLFATTKSLVACYDKTKQDPCSKMTIEIGSKDTHLSIMDFIDLSKIRIDPSKERYLHCDFAYSGKGDSLGLGMACVSKWVERKVMLPSGAYSTEFKPIIELDFILRIRAPEDDQIPLYKVRQFIIDLYNSGYNIALFTADLRAMSTDTRQLLESAGIPTDYLSVDTNSKVYRQFRDIVNEGRFVSHRHPYLHFELENLEKDPNKDKYDHPAQVSTTIIADDGTMKKRVLKGSKDMADGAAGAVFNAANFAEFEDGDSIIKLAENVTAVVKNSSLDRYDKFMLQGQASDEDLVDIDYMNAAAREGIITEKRHLQDKDGMYWLCYVDNEKKAYNFVGPHLEPLDIMPPEIIDDRNSYNPFKRPSIEKSLTNENKMLRVYAEILRKAAL
jgi:hypothetical protein